jgi:uncharacterized protein YqeY
MTIRERIEQDFIREFKAKNEAAVSTLRMLRAAIKNAEIEKMKPLEESDIMDVLGKEVKKLKDSLEAFSAGGRADLADKAKAEIALLEAYLPAQLDDDALRAIVKERAASVGAAGPKDFGKVMSEVMKEAKGRAEGSKVSAMVKEVLAGS